MVTIDSWDASRLIDYSELYPYLGTEIFWFIAAVCLWIFFHCVLVRFDVEDFRHFSIPKTSSKTNNSNESLKNLE